MFDIILEKIKTCVGSNVTDRIYSIDADSTVVKITPKTYDGTICKAELSVICIAKTYASALESFDKICDGVCMLPSEEGEILEINLKDTVIKYDTVSGMTRVMGIFDCYTEVMDNGIN